MLRRYIDKEESISAKSMQGMNRERLSRNRWDGAVLSQDTWNKTSLEQFFQCNERPGLLWRIRLRRAGLRRTCPATQAEYKPASLILDVNTTTSFAKPGASVRHCAQRSSYDFEPAKALISCTRQNWLIAGRSRGTSINRADTLRTTDMNQLSGTPLASRL